MNQPYGGVPSLSLQSKVAPSEQVENLHPQGVGPSDHKNIAYHFRNLIATLLNTIGAFGGASKFSTAHSERRLL